MWPAGKATGKGVARVAAPTPSPVRAQLRAPRQPSSSEGTYAMMYDLTLPIAVPATGIIALGAVYLISNDPARRSRAWQLLKLLYW
jgi:hypothetical protein